MTEASSFTALRTRFETLDGLRGVAAVMVVAFHVLEAFSNSDHVEQLINHGYLAVDFFFALSGFVIGHSYDGRWPKMGLSGFLKRRLIRLHPMILVGTLIGAALFCFGEGSSLYPKIAETMPSQLVLAVLMGFLLLPAWPSIDIRGWNEMYPLNGPMWTLFYEYVANLAYALVLRRLSNGWLAALAFAAGAALIHFAVTNASGDLIGGWSLEAAQIRVGLTRLCYPFLAGLLLARLMKPVRIGGAFFWSALLLASILAFPRVGRHENLWMNGFFDSLCVVFLFPAIVFIGASGQPSGRFAERACRFLGDISYPLYIVHYPLIYLFTAWAVDGKIALQDGFALGAAVFFGSIFLAWAAFRFYDRPVRQWLAQRFLLKN